MEANGKTTRCMEEESYFITIQDKMNLIPKAKELRNYSTRNMKEVSNTERDMVKESLLLDLTSSMTHTFTNILESSLKIR